jgi:hypothetical protein
VYGRHCRIDKLLFDCVCCELAPCFDDDLSLQFNIGTVHSNELTLLPADNNQYKKSVFMTIPRNLTPARSNDYNNSACWRCKHLAIQQFNPTTIQQ